MAESPVSKNVAEKQKTHVACTSGNVGFGTMKLKVLLSPETPLARDGRHTTRSLARALTTHVLATGQHES
jgi:hypothetical protein